MRGFLKIMLACLVAMLIVTGIMFFFTSKIISGISTSAKPEIKDNTVLMIDISKPIAEQSADGGLSFSEGKYSETLGLFDMVRAIKAAAFDVKIKGICLDCKSISVGAASCTELRNALLDFKKSGKFIIAKAYYMPENAYSVAVAANKIYCQPEGGLEWMGYSFKVTFFKNLLDKLEVKPEIFYAGQYKSATESFRLTKMSEPNRLQMTTFLTDLYSQSLASVAKNRNLDTTKIRTLANSFALHNASSAVSEGLIDGLLYEDEISKKIKDELKINESDEIPYINVADYIQNQKEKTEEVGSKIALVYAEGEIVVGEGETNEIGSNKYMAIFRKIRLDTTIKAVVVRVNSPGGNVLACETILREIMLIKLKKPVVISMGDYAASGGYLLSCMADSIFAQPNTLTGSIGVFTMFFNAQELFNNKLGITFDGVKTGDFADFGSTSRPMTTEEAKLVQEDIDSVYYRFKKRVADGRKLNTAYVETVAQGHIWSGKTALQLKLVDKLGGLQDAINCAARMAKSKNYALVELPNSTPFWKKILGAEDEEKKLMIQKAVIKEQLGSAGIEIFAQYKSIYTWAGTKQMRLPFFAKLNR